MNLKDRFDADVTYRKMGICLQEEEFPASPLDSAPLSFALSIFNEWYSKSWKIQENNLTEIFREL